VSGKELDGRVAIVTGGAAGIGRAIATRFVAEGARVVIADTDAERGAELALSLGPAAVFQRVDVSAADNLGELVESTVAAHGGLQVMVNNAGISGRMFTRFLDDDLADFNRVLAVNLLGPMAGTQHAGRYMAEHGGGSIINVSSLGGIRAGRSVIPYRASKAAVIHMTMCTAIDLAEYNVRVNCIAPGNIPTQLLAGSLTEDPAAAARVAATRALMAAMRPLKRDGTGEDVAETALYLASDRSAYVTGIVLPVDGGSAAGSPPARPAAPASADQAAPA
jgi:NAD(P)-dependent dehydrogenase (short-subunit alcohol dehydrogenase family)